MLDVMEISCFRVFTRYAREGGWGRGKVGEEGKQNEVSKREKIGWREGEREGGRGREGRGT